MWWERTLKIKIVEYKSKCTIPYIKDGKFVKYGACGCIHIRINLSNRPDQFYCHQCCIGINNVRPGGLLHHPGYPIRVMKPEISVVNSGKFDDMHVTNDSNWMSSRSITEYVYSPSLFAILETLHRRGKFEELSVSDEKIHYSELDFKKLQSALIKKYMLDNSYLLNIINNMAKIYY